MADGENLRSQAFLSGVERARLGTRYFWVVVALSVMVFTAWVGYGLYYNAHTSSTVGGPLTVVLCIFLGFVSDVLLWALALVAGLTYSYLRKRREGPARA